MDIVKAVDNPNVRKMLDLISNTEGTAKLGYLSGFGGAQLSSLDAHPRVRSQFVQNDGKSNATTAAGRYQILQGTWDDLAKQHGLKDFSARNQDIAAVALLQQTGALPDVLAGNFTGAINKSGKIWASLPSSNYAQPKKGWKTVSKQLGDSYDPLEEILSKQKPAAPKSQTSSDPLEEILTASKAKQASAPKQRSWSDVPLEAISNVPKSAENFAGGIAHAVAHPIDTVGDVLDIGAGAVAKAMPETVAYLDKKLGTQKNTERTTKKASAVAQFFKERYGSSNDLKKTIATDPVGFAADVASVLTGGATATAKVPQLARASAVLDRAASAVNPISAATTIARGTGKVVGKTIGGVVKHGLGLTTGVGGETIAQAAKAGFNKNQSFIDNLTGAVPKSDLVSKLESAMQVMKNKKSNDYKANIATTAADTTPLKFDAIDTALSDGMATTKSKHGMSLINDTDAAKLDELQSVVSEWRNTPAAHTSGGLDELKKRIDAIPVDHVNANAATRIVAQVRNAVKKTIVDQSPEYASTMSKYEAATELENEIKKAFSTGGNASTDTTLRKLQSLARDNVNTSYGYRAELADALKNGTGEDLMPAIAGQAASSWTPRGLAGLLAGGTGLAGYANPHVLAALPLQSPRLVASALYGAGRAAGATASAANKATAPLRKAGVTKAGAKKVALLSSEIQNALGAQANQ